MLETVKEAHQPYVHLSQILSLSVVSELQGDLSFISCDFIFVSGMSSLHNEETHYYPKSMISPFVLQKFY